MKDCGFNQHLSLLVFALAKLMKSSAWKEVLSIAASPDSRKRRSFCFRDAVACMDRRYSAEQHW